ncbi:ABC-2 family transporter protein [compost metagenome]
MLLKLISLELRKYQFARYFGYAAIANIAIFFILVMLGFIDYGAKDYAYATYAQSIILIDSCVRATFIVFAGVLLSKMIISEYKNQTMNVLFTYPIPRHKLIAAKLIIIFFFTCSMILLSDVILAILLVIAAYFYPFISDTLTMEQVPGLLLKYTVSALSAASMAMIPLFFGMRKYSVTTTIVSSVLLMLIVCSGFNGPAVSINSIIVIPLVLGMVGLWIAWMSLLRLETSDVS